MKHLLSKRLFIIIFLFSILGTNSQELPPVVNFGPNEYSAGNQNWMIAQGENENLYFANSTGLLEYNGEKWNLYPVPNNTIVRSLKVIGDRIYTGAYMEAGYWTRNKFGELVYSSLVNEFKEGISDGEQFWDIEFLDDLVIFRSFGGIYFYDPQHESVTKLENPLGKPIAGIFNVEDELFYQYVGEGLYKIENGSSELVIPYDQLGDTTIMHLYFGKGELSESFQEKLNFLTGKNSSLKRSLNPSMKR